MDLIQIIGLCIFWGSMAFMAAPGIIIIIVDIVKAIRRDKTPTA